MMQPLSSVAGVASALIALSAANALAAPSFDCARAESTVETLICEDDALAAQDARLAEVFAAAMDRAQGLDAGAEDAVETLRAVQRGWIKGRDDCWKSDDPKRCVEDAYLTREGALVAQWLLSAPTSTAFWTCGANRMEVATLFFDTPLPALRLEIGDRVRTATLARSASGSRYTGDFGEEIWIKGESARYRTADPDGQEFACTLRAE